MGNKVSPVPAGAVFLDSSVLNNRAIEESNRIDVQYNKIRFEFPNGFAQIRLIEECRALNALDVSDPDNFDLMYDITMQMLVGKVVYICLIEDDVKKQLASFVVTDRYMNMRSIDIIDEYPVIINWLVEFVAGYLSKKYPRSSEDVQARMSARSELMKSLKAEEPQVTIRTMGVDM